MDQHMVSQRDLIECGYVRTSRNHYFACSFVKTPVLWAKVCRSLCRSGYEMTAGYDSFFVKYF
jgi:hypothetical protein